MTERSLQPEGNHNIGIIIADDHPLLRQALRNVLEQQTDFKIIAEASNGEEAVKLASEIVPNVIIMDIGMPIMNGIEATKLIKSQFPQIAILVLTVHNDNEHILEILDAGASGYLIKSVFGEEVVNAIRTVVTGETILSTEVFRQILKHSIRHMAKPSVHATGTNLSVRDMEIIKLVAKGMCNKDIALKLNLSTLTVKSYLVDIFNKLNVRSRTELIRTGLKNSFINISDLD